MNLRDAAQQAERVLYKSRSIVAEDGASALLIEYIEVLNNLRAALAEPEQAEPVAWRDHVEQRIRTWKQRKMNRHGDFLALDDFMGADSIDDFVDFVCAVEQAHGIGEE